MLLRPQTENLRVIELLLRRLPEYIANIANLDFHRAAEGMNPNFKRTRCGLVPRGQDSRGVRCER